MTKPQPKLNNRVKATITIHPLEKGMLGTVKKINQNHIFVYMIDWDKLGHTLPMKPTEIELI